MVRMPRDVFERGELPSVCVKSGEPADQTVEATFRWLPPWTYLLLLAGVLPFLIAVFFAEEKVVGRVPVRHRIVARRRQLGRLVWGWLAVALLAGIGAGATGTDWLWWGSLVGLVGAVGTLVQRDWGWLDVRPVRSTSTVEVRRVHPGFVTALEVDPSLTRLDDA
jgi:hypothetical protein